MSRKIPAKDKEEIDKVIQELLSDPFYFLSAIKINVGKEIKIRGYFCYVANIEKIYKKSKFIIKSIKYMEYYDFSPYIRFIFEMYSIEKNQIYYYVMTKSLNDFITTFQNIFWHLVPDKPYKKEKKIGTWYKHVKEQEIKDLEKKELEDQKSSGIIKP